MAEAIGALAVKISADIGDFVDGFNRADKAVDKFTKQLDRRVSEPLAKITAAAAAAGAAVFAFTKGAADMVDELGKLSQKVGVSVEALSGLKYAADLNNVSLDQLGQGLKQLSKFMVENKVTGVSTEEQLLKIADEFARSKDGAEKTAAAMKFFGKSGADLIPLLNQGRAGIEELRKEAEKLGIVFSTEAAKRAEEFNDNLTRLKSAAQGLQVELAGPLVEALNKAAKAMLEAKNQGDSFFRTMVEGFRTLVTGDDAHKWNVEFVKATDRVLDAQSNLDRALNQPGWLDPFGENVKRARAELAAAEADIKRLQAIKPILAPEPVPGEKKTPTGTVIVPDDPSKSQRDADLIARQAEESAEIQAQIMAEAAALTDQFRAQEREKQLAFLELGLQEHEVYGELNVTALKAQYDERNRILIAAYDAEQEAAIERGKAIIQSDEETNARQKALAMQRLRDTQSALGNLASLMNTNSRRTFEIGKAAALAQAGVSTVLATIQAFQKGTEQGGYWYGVAMAALAAAAGLNMMNNLRSQSFGGGGGAPTPVGQGASGVAAPTQTPAAAGGDGGGGQTTIISLQGDSFSPQQVRALIEKLNDGQRNGDRFIVR